MFDWSLGEYELTATQLLPAAERAVAEAAIGAGERVLDVACGTGNAALLAAARGGVATGVDSAPRLLEVAAERAREAGVAAEWRAGEAAALPVPDGGFDAVLSVFGVIFAQPPEPAVAELVRATAPGGRIVLTTWTAEGTVAAAGQVVRRAIAEFAGPDAVATGPAPRDWGDPQVLATLFGAHGIAPRVERVPLAFVAASPEAFADEWLTSHPMWLAARDLLGEQRYAALREPLVAALEEGNEDPDGFRATSVYLLVRAEVD
ncbi:class I SAM-dependent methyltransferase [Patulibacter defluvii]|uniref:class I SAM-dependent methyltransferase n=1 Tax=Patulibacter defluvii TaxID=3095358 RepID=UPI002A756444|nr:class I SAM-dependent methyltransferase [Patulibacter sp. DM4]